MCVYPLDFVEAETPSSIHPALRTTQQPNGKFSRQECWETNQSICVVAQPHWMWGKSPWEMEDSFIHIRLSLCVMELGTLIIYFPLPLENRPAGGNSHTDAGENPYWLFCFLPEKLFHFLWWWWWVGIIEWWVEDCIACFHSLSSWLELQIESIFIFLSTQTRVGGLSSSSSSKVIKSVELIAQRSFWSSRIDWLILPCGGENPLERPPSCVFVGRRSECNNSSSSTYNKHVVQSLLGGGRREQ